MPGWEVAIVGREGRELPAGESCEVVVKRKGEWFYIKYRGRRDVEGYFFHQGRSGDVTIPAGWTMSAVEIENSLLKHPAALEELAKRFKRRELAAMCDKVAREGDLRRWRSSRSSVKSR